MSFSGLASPQGRRNTILASVAVAALGVAGVLGESALTPTHPAYAAAVSTADLPQNAPSFAPLIDRVKESKDYDACVLGIGSPDADPNSDLNVWLSSGGTHLWNPSQDKPATPWEAEIDGLMEQQLVATSFEQRKKLYDRVQQILADYQPMIFLASPDILTGAKNAVGNFHPAVREPYVLWNAEQLYLRNDKAHSAP